MMMMTMITSAILSSMVASISFPSLCRPWWHCRSHCCRRYHNIISIKPAITGTLFSIEDSWLAML